MVSMSDTQGVKKMIIECNDVLISTNEDVKEHKVRIKATGISDHCESYKPEIWFANKNKNISTHWKLKYNKDGSELIKVTAWDVNPKYNNSGCYFENRGLSIAMNDRTLYKRHWWN